MKIGVQLYTLRSLLEQDLWGTLARLADAGFKNVELAGDYGKSAIEWSENLAKLGLTATSSHTGIQQIESDFDGVVAFAKALNYKYIICPWISEEYYSVGWAAVGRQMNEIGSRLSEHDLQYGYHNHSFEMVKVTDRTGLQMLYDNSSGANVVAEIDCYWIQHGEGNPAQYIQDLSGRVPLVHFKDMGKDGGFIEVGDGILDWDDIIESSKAAGTEYAIIEHDNPTMDPMESVVRSRKFLVEKGLSD